MKRLIIAMILSLFAGFFCYSQINTLDSLTTIWQNTNLEDSIRLEAGRSVFMAHFRNNPDSARKIGLEMLQLALASNDKPWEATIQKLIGNSLAVQGNYTQAVRSIVNPQSLG